MHHIYFFFFRCSTERRVWRPQIVLPETFHPVHKIITPHPVYVQVFLKLIPYFLYLLPGSSLILRPWGAQDFEGGSNLTTAAIFVN